MEENMFKKTIILASLIILVVFGCSKTDEKMDDDKEQ